MAFCHDATVSGSVVANKTRRGFREILHDYPQALDFLWRRLPNGLYVFNYHRIGDAEASPFDSNVFSCDERAFREHVRLIKSNFELIDTTKLVNEVLHAPLNRRLALLTFDDGYHDNFAAAFPILKEEGASAVFFLPTGLIESPTVPWWDEIAWLIKNSQEPSVTASFIAQPIARVPKSINNTVRQVLNAFKASSLDAEVKVAELRKTLRCELSDKDRKQLFVSWEEAKLMSDGGMDIGSHAHSHRILSHLSREEQRQELESSKAMLEERLGRKVDTVAYPVGSREAFNETTLELAKASGYKAGFSYISGINYPGKMQYLELRRIPVDCNANAERLKATTLLSTDFGLNALRLMSSTGSWVRRQVTSK